MLKEYIVRTKVEAFFLNKSIDKDFLRNFFNAIPHTVSDEGVTIISPEGETLIEYDKYYMMFDVGSGQLLSIEKDRFEENATLANTTDLDSWEGTNEECH